MDKLKRLAALCSLILCTLMCGCGTSGGEVILIGRGETEDVQAVWDSQVNAVETAVEETAVSEIRVYVCGAVESPGVVTLVEGSRAEDALLAAGGFSENAWKDYVNLAERVTDGQKLYFPTLDEAENLAEQETADGLVNINTADVATLCTLPGIGESRAKDIIAYRETHGNFESCEDIMKVSGIKTSIYSKISDRITVK